MKAIFFIILCGTFSACRPSSSQKRTRSEIEGTQAERVTRATAILTKYSKLPGPLLDAHMAEDLADNSGGWVPGPTDCFLSGLITFPAADLPKWQKVLGQELAQETPKFNSCLAAPAWWPAATAFKDCEYYEPKKLTGHLGGMVALSPASAAIYFSTSSN